MSKNLTEVRSCDTIREQSREMALSIDRLCIARYIGFSEALTAKHDFLNCFFWRPSKLKSRP